MCRTGRKWCYVFRAGTTAIYYGVTAGDVSFAVFLLILEMVNMMSAERRMSTR